MEKNNKIKYDADYISYVENGESAAVFVARDILKQVDTRRTWIDITDLEGDKAWVEYRDRRGERRREYRWDFDYFEIELFPRKIHPKYPEWASDEEKKYITWGTAHKDIEAQRRRGYKGVRYRVSPRLVNRNKGKGKPKWDYEIVSYTKLRR